MFRMYRHASPFITATIAALATFSLVIGAAFAQTATASTNSFDWTTIVVTILTVVVAPFLAHYLRSRGISERAVAATTLLVQAAAIGVRAAASAYTDELKKASADGRLTDEEAKTARLKARNAALATIGPRTLQLLKDAYGHGLDAALDQALEAGYRELKSP